MEHKHLLSYAYVENLKTKIKKMQGRIEDELSQAIETLENVIDIKDEKIDELNKEIDELNKKIKELKQPKKAVENQTFDCTEVDLVRIPNTRWYSVRLIVYVEPELYKVIGQDNIYICINGRRYYLSNTEIIDGRMKTKIVSSMGYELVEAQEIAEKLLNNDIYGNVEVVKER